MLDHPYALLFPVLALAAWTLVVLAWLFAERMPAMAANRAKLRGMKMAHEMRDLMPPRTLWVGDNFTHLHEQPTVFYAVALSCHLAGAADPFNAGLAWAYVVLRVAHSFVQNTTNAVPLRFLTFAASAVALAVLLGRTVAMTI